MKAVLISILLMGLSAALLAQDENTEQTPSPETYIEQDRYISDLLFVPLRSGTSSQHRIVHKGLRSGSAVTLLKEDKENGWSLVRTKRGVEGWLRSQYLFAEPTASVKLIRAEKTIQQLSSKAGPLSEKLISAESEIRSLNKNSFLVFDLDIVIIISSSELSS